MSGYFVPPVSGSYTFYVSADDNFQLFFSTEPNSMDPKNLNLAVNH